MGKHGFIAAIVLSVLIMGGCGSGGGNIELLVNGGVESGITAPDSWWKVEDGNTLTWATDQVHTGARSLQCTVANTNMAFWVQTLTSPIPTGRRLKLSAWIKCDSLEGSGVSIAIRGDDANPTPILWASTQETTTINGTTDWVRYEVESLPVPDGTVSILSS